MNARTPARLMIVAACGAMAWCARHALDIHSLLISWDLEGHLLRARHAATTLSPQLAFTAWFPYWHGGFPLPEVYPPLATWLLGIFVALGVDAFAARLILVGAWMAVVPCSYYFLRSFEVDRVFAAAAACLAATIDANWTFGAHAIFTLGLLPNALGFVCAILCLGSVRKLAGGFSSPTAVARTALLGGLTILAHPFAAVWVAIASAWLTLTRRFTDEKGALSTRPLLLAGLWAVVIGSFYWLPFLANRQNLLPTEPFFPKSIADGFRTMALLDGMGGPVAALLAIAGLAALSIPAQRPRLVFFSGLLAIGFILSTGILAPILPFSNFFGRTQWARFEGFYGWSVLMLVAFALEAARRWMAPARRAAALTAFLMGVTLTTAAVGLYRQRKDLAFVTPASVASLDAMAGDLGPRVHSGDFMLSENAVEMADVLGSPHFLNQRLPRLNPIFWDQGGSLPEGTNAAERFFAVSRDFSTLVPDARGDLADGGVRFLVTVRRESRDALDRLPWLKRLWSDERVNGLALFEVVGFERRFGLPTDLSPRVDEVDFTAASGYHVSFNGPQQLSYPLTTAVAFHPWLKANADGVPLVAGEGDLKRLVFSSGPESASELFISYEPPRWFVPFRLLAVFAFLLAVVIGWPRRRATLDI